MSGVEAAAPAPILVRSGRHPVAICMLVAFVVISAYGLVNGPPSVSVDAGLTLVQRVLWGVQCGVGGTLALIGLYVKPMLTGLYVERVGQLLVGFGAATYVWVLCDVSTFHRSGLVVTCACAVSIGSFWRAGHIRSDVKLWRAANRGEAA